MNTKYEAGTRVSEYLLEECIGTGSFGEVWRARHHVWDQERVAIKLPTEPEYVRYLRQEGVVVHGLRHPNIVRVMGLDPYAEIPYLVMELVDGPSLRQVIDAHPKGLPVETTLTLLRGMLAAIVAAHQADIVHRDLKPGNVLLNLGDRPLAGLDVEDVKLGDFGLGFGNEDSLRSVVLQSASIAREEESAQIAGTVAYMAPEVRDGRERPGPKSDLFAVGVILFEMLTGERPAGAELPSTLRADVPEALDEVFRGLYARHDRRYERAAVVIDDLERRLALPTAPPAAAARPVSAPWDAAPAAPAAGRCPRCGATALEGDQFCTDCGFQLVQRVRRCPTCGGYPSPGDRFCIYCGTELPAVQEV